MPITFITLAKEMMFSLGCLFVCECFICLLFALQSSLPTNACMYHSEVWQYYATGLNLIQVMSWFGGGLRSASALLSANVVVA